MPRGLDDAVRTYQLPTDGLAQSNVAQTGLSANLPIYITPGMGANAGGQLPPIQTGSGSFSFTETYYCQQATVEEGVLPQGLGRMRALRRRV